MSCFLVSSAEDDGFGVAKFNLSGVDFSNLFYMACIDCASTAEYFKSTLVTSASTLER